MRPRAQLPLLCLLALLSTGCGRGGPKTYPVSGSVTFGGVAVPKGHIVFTPLDASLAPEAAKIVDGKFSLRARAGKKRVEIIADREVGVRDPVMGVVPREAYIPAKYNDETILEAEVVPDGENEFVFELEEDEEA